MAALAGGDDGILNARHDRADDLYESPHRCHRDGTGTDETHLGAKDRQHRVGKAVTVLDPSPRKHRQEDSVGEQHADGHGDTHRHAHQVAHADQGEGQAGPEEGPARTHAEDAFHRGGGDLHGVKQGIAGRRQAAQNNGVQAAAVVLCAAVGVAHFQDLGGRHALGIGKIGTGDQGAAQRNGVHDPEYPADGAQESGGPVGEAGPPSHNHQAGEDEDDGGQGASG